MNKVDVASRSGEMICKSFLPINIGSHRSLAFLISGILITALILQAMPCMASPAVDSVSGRPVIHLFEASPSIVNSGENATLNWTVSRADILFVDPGGIILNLGNSSSGISEINGSIFVRPINSTNYTLIAENAVGNTTANTSVIVNKSLAMPREIKQPVITQPVIRYFQATPSTIKNGESTTLSWSVSDATEVTISGLGKVALKGSMAIMPVGTTTYVLAAKNAGEVVTAHTVVAVERPTQSKPVINSFYADSRRIIDGQSTTLYWSVSGASNIAIDRIGPVPSTGSRLIRPSSTTTYTLTASNDAGSTAATAQISVTPRPRPPVINYFGASKGVISRGDSTTLSWSVSGADGVDINGRRVGSSGSISVSPSYSTAFTLSACNDGGCARDSAYIEVGEVAIQPINLMPEPQPQPQPYPEPQPEPANPIQLM